MSAYRFAAPAYANSVPLARFIPEISPGAEVILDHPAQLLARVLEGRVDAALMPVADLFAHPELDLVRGLGICAERRVRSVLLRCQIPLDQVRSVKLDRASRTSNALARLLLARHWKRDARIISGDSAETTDAAVVIGDRALCEPKGPAGDLDLAEAWNDMTGLPFVFAAWAFRRDHPQPALLESIVLKARDCGIAALAEVAREQSTKLRLPEALCRDYFTTCIHYEVGPRHREALQLFKSLIASWPT